jgi:hypothetical protein
VASPSNDHAQGDCASPEEEARRDHHFDTRVLTARSRVTRNPTERARRTDFQVRAFLTGAGTRSLETDASINHHRPDASVLYGSVRAPSELAVTPSEQRPKQPQHPPPLFAGFTTGRGDNSEKSRNHNIAGNTRAFLRCFSCHRKSRSDLHCEYTPFPTPLRTHLQPSQTDHSPPSRVNSDTAAPPHALLLQEPGPSLAQLQQIAASEQPPKTLLRGAEHGLIPNPRIGLTSSK